MSTVAGCSMRPWHLRFPGERTPTRQGGPRDTRRNAPPAPGAGLGDRGRGTGKEGGKGEKGPVVAVRVPSQEEERKGACSLRHVLLRLETMDATAVILLPPSDLDAATTDDALLPRGLRDRLPFLKGLPTKNHRGEEVVLLDQGLEIALTMPVIFLPHTAALVVERALGGPFVPEQLTEAQAESQASLTSDPHTAHYWDELLSLRFAGPQGWPQSLKGQRKRMLALQSVHRQDADRARVLDRAWRSLQEPAPPPMRQGMDEVASAEQYEDIEAASTAQAPKEAENPKPASRRPKNQRRSHEEL